MKTALQCTPIANRLCITRCAIYAFCRFAAEHAKWQSVCGLIVSVVLLVVKMIFYITTFINPIESNRLIGFTFHI